MHNKSLCEGVIADLQELLDQGKKTLAQIADDLRKLDYPDEVVDDAVGRLKAPSSSLRGTQFSQNVRRYMDAIEQHTGFRLHPSQRVRLADDLRTTNYSRLSPEAGRVHRRGFTQRVREAQIAEWERQTGQAWPRYTEDLYTKSGEVYKKIGDPYDAHHVIENVYGGPHEWWNLTPAGFPDQHQSGIHLEEIMKTLFP